MQLIKKIQQGLKILKLTSYKYFRASQVKDKEIVYFINHHPVVIKGPFTLSMLLEIVADDVYHLKEKNDPKIIFDVGANIGIFSLHAATLFPGSVIYAFEPSAENFTMLKANTKQFKNIHCLNKAISNYNGLAYINDNKNNTAFTISSTATENVLHTCSTITLRTFISEHGINEIDVLKLDCEGAEYDIVNDDIAFANEIVGEYHYSPVHSLDSFKNNLVEKGFSIKEWTGYASGIFWAINKRVND